MKRIGVSPYALVLACSLVWFFLPVYSDEPNPIFLPPASLTDYSSVADESEKSDKPEEEKLPPVYEVGAQDEMTFRWNNGLVGETEDKAFKFHIGGRAHFDNAWYGVPASSTERFGTQFEDGSAFRRLRLRTDGTFWEQIDFMIEFDFSSGSDFRSPRPEPINPIFITDAWLTFTEIPWVHNIRVGHQKERLTFTNSSSSRFIPFIERPFLFDAIENDFQFNNGVSLFRSWLDERMTTWVGVFRTDARSGAFGVGDGAYAVDGRWTLLPIYDEAEQRWLNLGIAGSIRALPDDQEERARLRPLVRGGSSFQVPTIADTGTFFGTDGLQVGTGGVHGAWGPWSFGGEYMMQFTNDSYLGGLPNSDGSLPEGVSPAGDVFLHGWYAHILYFLTPGDHHPLDKEFPGYDRVEPLEPFFLVRDRHGRTRKGLGAWEIGLRYNHIDLSSGAIQGGVLDSVTLGLNWYLTSNARVMMNYEYTRRRESTELPSAFYHGFGTRMAFDF